MLLLAGAMIFSGGCLADDVVNAGVPNFHRVNSSLYRSGQPTEAGFAFLGSWTTPENPALPIRTIVSLRAFNDDDEHLPDGSPLRLEKIRFKTWHAEDEDVVKFLRIVTTPALQPVLVHCQHGSDRTGSMVAIYRVVVEGWSKAEAINEMVGGDFGFHPIWQNLIRYINEIDIGEIRAELAKQGPWS